jgi:hypothetical protein
MIGAELRQQKRADEEPGPGLTLFGHDARNRKRNPHKLTAVVKAMVCFGA